MWSAPDANPTAISDNRPRVSARFLGRIAGWLSDVEPMGLKGSIGKMISSFPGMADDKTDQALRL